MQEIVYTCQVDFIVTWKTDGYIPYIPTSRVANVLLHCLHEGAAVKWYKENYTFHYLSGILFASHSQLCPLTIAIGYDIK